MPLARVGARTDSTTSYSYNARRGQLPRTRIGIVRRTRARHAVCAEGLHFSAFHWVCVSVNTHLTYGAFLERLFVLKTLSRTQRATKVKKFVGICLKRLHSRVILQNMSKTANMLIFMTYPRSDTAKCQRAPNNYKQNSALPKQCLLMLLAVLERELTAPCVTATMQGLANFCTRALG